MRIVFTENLHALSLPTGHKFPLGKYGRIVAELSHDFPEMMLLGAPAGEHDLALVHDLHYVRAVREGTLSASAIRRLGFPWSESLVTRALRSVGGTLSALAWAVESGAAGHLAGGTHHAFRDRGEGFCVFNDIAVAVEVAKRDYGITRAAIVDLDVHQGNGTAAIFEHDESVYCLSIHAKRNYPFQKERSTLDVELADDTTDASYLRALDDALGHVRAHRPEILFYQAGVDCLANDRLGRMSLSEGALVARDARVYETARALHVPVVVTLGGGYGRDIERTVRAHVNVYRGMVNALA